MKTNCDVTLYNKYIDPDNRTDKYQRTEIRGVFWENRKAANVIKSGLLAADQASIYISFAVGTNHLDPVEWQALEDKTGKWTLQVGDYIVKGIVTDEVSSTFTITKLKAKYDDVLAISSIDTQDYGSASMRHWQLGGK